MELREWRNQKGLTKGELAELLEVSVRSIRNWEKREPTKLLKMYLEILPLYINSLKMNKSFRARRMPGHKNLYGIYVWGAKNKTHNDWILWRKLPPGVAKKLGLLRIASGPNSPNAKGRKRSNPWIEK